MIQMILSLIILGIIYTRMIKRETPEMISKPQAVIPVICGMLSVAVSFLLFMGIALSLTGIGISLNNLPPVIRSFNRAFLAAGIPEETVKFAFMLLMFRVFRSRIKNVYEYILIGAAVGFGFTLLEEFFYGSGGMIEIFRILTLAAHVIFGIIMAKHLGTAAYNKAAGSGPVAREYVLAFVVPVLIHTVFDAFTGLNLLLDSTEDAEVMIGMFLSAAAMIVMFVMQIVVLNRLKKNTEMYCGMTF